MDGNSYPPPAPAVPPPTAPQAAYPAAEPPKKKKTALIIGIVVVVLLLCCCGSAGIGYFVYKAAQDTTSETIDEITGELDTELPDLSSDSTSDSGPALGTGWEDFAPASYDPSVFVDLEPFHEEVVTEVTDTLFPDFELREAIVKPSTEFTTDLVLARAALSGDSGTQIAFYLEVENTDAFDSGWTNDPNDTEYEYLDPGTASNGREYFWDNTQLVPLFGGMDSTTEDLLRQVASDFPGCVIYLLESDGETGYVEFTKWEAYPDYAAGFSADYTYDGDAWVLDSAGEW